MLDESRPPWSSATRMIALGRLVLAGCGLVVLYLVPTGPGGFVQLTYASLVLCVVFGAAFTWPFIFMGLVSGSSQAAQGMSFLAFPVVFVSSAYVPVASMPGWMQPVARNQPVTQMVGAVRALALGDHAEAILGHSAGWFAIRALAWAVVIVAVFATLATRKFSKA